MSFQKFQIVNKGGIANIQIVGEINWWRNSADEFTRLVDQLISDGCTDVDGYICTPGGSVFDANEIGNQIQRFPGAKNLKCGALVASAGTAIATYFDNVIAASNTIWMIHDPILKALIEHLNDFDSNKKMYETLRNNLIDRYHAQTKIPKEKLSEMMTATTWMGADEARTKGFVNRVDTEVDNVLPTDMQDVFNKYNIKTPTHAMNVLNAITNNSKTKEDTNMKEIALKLGLSENATSEQITAAIAARDAELAKLKGIANAAQTLVVNMGVEKGLKKETVEKMATADFSTALEMVSEIKATSTPDGDGGKGGDGGQGEDPNKDRPFTFNDMLNAFKQGDQKLDVTDNATFGEMWEKEPSKLKALFAKNPIKVEQMYKEEYGSLPDNNELKNLLK